MSNFVAEKATAPRLKRYRATRCMLYYITEQTEETVNLLPSDAWVTLESGSSNDNVPSVGPVDFDGSVVIAQKATGRKCVLTWSPQQYTLLSAELDPKKYYPIWVLLKPGKERSIEFSGDEAAARELPLAKCHESFKYIKLTMWFNDMKRPGALFPQHREGVRRHLEYLLTHQLRIDPQATEGPSQDQSSLNPAPVVQVAQGSSTIASEMKREEETAAEVAEEKDGSDDLDAEISASQQYKEECERVWRRIRREEAEACENYVAAVKQLEELRSRRDNAANKESSGDR